MRFKIYFNELKQVLDINCLNDCHSDTILPNDPSQHVFYPIPNDLKKEIKDELMTLISDESSAEYNAITEQIKLLTDKRRDMINELRSSLNPKIMEKCEKFKVDHAEYFI